MGYDGKPVRKTDDAQSIRLKNPLLSMEQITKKLPLFKFGDELATQLILVSSHEDFDTVAKMKIFRTASKISGKMDTDKAELTVDLIQVNEMMDWLNKLTGYPSTVSIPVLLVLDDAKSELS